MILKYIKKGLYNTVCYGCSALITRILGFLLLPYFLSSLTLVEFGVWDFYLHFFLLVSTLIASGVSAILIRFSLEYQYDRYMQQAAFGNSFLCAVHGSLLFAFLGAGAFFLSISSYVILMFCNTSLFILFSALIAYVRVNEWLLYYLLISCVQYSISLGGTVLGVYYGYGIISFFYCNALSYIIFIPYFFYIFLQHRMYSWALFKKQALYGAPLIIFNVLYMAFFTIDRLAILYFFGASALGEYSILWRFGALLQYGTMALNDAAPIVFFNAQKEDTAACLMPKLQTYLFCVFGTICIGALLGSHYIIDLFLSQKYGYLLQYLPLFFFVLCVLEASKFLQAGFHLATKTMAIPFLIGATLIIQLSLHSLFHTFGITGIFINNCCAFSLYAAASLLGSIYIYSVPLFNLQQLAILLLSFGMHLAFIYYASVSILSAILIFLSWLLSIWFFVLDSEDREYCHQYITILFKHDSKKNFLFGKSIQDHNYTKNIFQRSILIVGPVPPPLGGVSVHIERSIRQLKVQKNNIIICDPSRRSSLYAHIMHLINLFFSKKVSHIFYHISYKARDVLIECIVISFFSVVFRTKLYIIDHDCRDLYTQNWCIRKLFSLSFRAASRHILIGTSTAKSYIETNTYLKKDTCVESAFLPPDTKQESEIIKKYPAEIQQFIQDHSPLIVANAFQLLRIDDKDIYGFDVSVHALMLLKQQYDRCGLLFLLAQVGDVEYFEQYQQYFKEHNLHLNILLPVGNYELWPLLKKADIFLRPTLSDGYSVSICEALHFNIPTIASDVVERPQECILFNPKIIDDLYVKVLKILC